MESSTQVTPRLAKYFREYSGFHQTSGNEFCHYVGIPMILLAIVGLLARVSFGPEFSPELRLDLGVLGALGAAVWYLLLDWRVGAPFTLVLFGNYFLGRAIPGVWLWVLFVLGWVFQLVGHYKYEKKSPAFLKNI